MLQVELYDPETPAAEICYAYWQQVGRQRQKRTSALPRPVYAYSVSEVARRFGLSHAELRRVVGENCCSFDPDWICPHCGKPRIFFMRSEVELAEHMAADAKCGMCRHEDFAEQDSVNWPTWG